MRHARGTILGLGLATMLFGCATAVGGETAEVEGEGAALIGPDGDLNDFPPWAWPYIRPAAIFTHALSGAISIKEARVAMETAAKDCGCALAASRPKVQTVLAAVGATFDTQYAAARLAIAGGGSEAKFYEGDGYCGNGIPPFPGPRPRGLFDLLQWERELMGDAILGSADLDERGAAAVNAELDRQLERFKALEM